MYVSTMTTNVTTTEGVDVTTSAVHLNIVHVTLPFGDYITNATKLNDTPTTDPPYTPNVWRTTLIVIVCSCIIIGTILGNSLVILAVALVKKLQTPSNMLIVSLAVSDMLVGLVIMPFAIMMEVTNGYWLLSDIYCDVWTSLDVLVCTASILNLCAISIDRYFVIKKPLKYAIKRTPKRMLIMITCVWFLAAAISIPPLLGWKPVRKEGECSVSQAIGYQILATMSAFYLPLAIMLFIYYKIYRVSHKLAKAEAKSKPSGDYTKSISTYSMTPLKNNSYEDHNLPHNGSAKKSDASRSDVEIIPRLDSVCGHKEKYSFLRKMRLKGKESKATKTLGVIMGAFIACWLPFFILALIKPFCDDPISCFPHLLNSMLLWLGYTNSLLNPMIYARFNREFRTPFVGILKCNCRKINQRLRKDAYADQYGTGVSRKDSVMRPPQSSTVKYESQGHTFVKLGNGDCGNNNGLNL